jgi:hypothetical protein
MIGCFGCRAAKATAAAVTRARWMMWNLGKKKLVDLLDENVGKKQKQKQKLFSCSCFDVGDDQQLDQQLKLMKNDQAMNDGCGDGDKYSQHPFFSYLFFFCKWEWRRLYLLFDLTK